MDIQVIVATHKPYRMPEDPMYLPVQVGSAASGRKLNYTADDTGENISSKNPGFCELTGLYWAWKNLSADYIGLVHYRRYFRGHAGREKWSCILSGEEAETLLRQTDVLLPRPRNYFIETCYSQYIHAHPAQGLDLALKLAAGTGAPYKRAVDAFLKSRKAHLFNMFIMKRELLDAYCQWLFPILFEMERELDTSGWSENDRRVFGFAAERLLDVWLDANGVRYRELPVMFMERQNWLKKGGAFLKRKFFPARGSGRS